MPFYLLSSNTSNFLSIEFHGENEGAAFAAAKRFCFDDAQLWQDGRYITTIRRQGAERDYWLLLREEFQPINPTPARALPLPATSEGWDATQALAA